MKQGTLAITSGSLLIVNDHEIFGEPALGSQNLKDGVARCFEFVQFLFQIGALDFRCSPSFHGNLLTASAHASS